MEKINFTDTTVTKKPYVEVDGVEYEVQDGTYDGGTDLNANTFNTMQTNIENGINEKGNYTNLTNKPQINSVELSDNKTLDDLSIQTKLVSGTNIKTINNQNLLGEGNITIQGGSGGTTDYDQLENRPQINNVTLTGNKSLSDLGITNFSGNYNDLSNKPTIPTKTSDLSNDSGFIDSSDIVNNLTSDDTTKILSAAMGKKLRNLINIDRVRNVDLSTIKYHCLCGVDNSCTSWIGGYGMLICIPLSQNSEYAVQIGFNNTTAKWRNSIIDGTYSDWKTFS